MRSWPMTARRCMWPVRSASIIGRGGAASRCSSRTRRRSGRKLLPETGLQRFHLFGDPVAEELDLSNLAAIAPVDQAIAVTRRYGCAIRRDQIAAFEILESQRVGGKRHAQARHRRLRQNAAMAVAAAEARA